MIQYTEIENGLKAMSCLNIIYEITTALVKIILMAGKTPPDKCQKLFPFFLGPLPSGQLNSIAFETAFRYIIKDIFLAENCLLVPH